LIEKIKYITEIESKATTYEEEAATLKESIERLETAASKNCNKIEEKNKELSNLKSTVVKKMSELGSFSPKSFKQLKVNNIHISKHIHLRNEISTLSENKN